MSKKTSLAIVIAMSMLICVGVDAKKGKGDDVQGVISVQIKKGMKAADVYAQQSIYNKNGIKVTTPAFPLYIEVACEQLKKCSISIPDIEHFPTKSVPCSCNPKINLIDIIEVEQTITEKRIK